MVLVQFLRSNSSFALGHPKVPSPKLPCTSFANSFKSTPYFNSFATIKKMSYSLKESGQKDTLEFRGYVYNGNNAISPFHDIALWADKTKGIANMLVEIPKGQQAKLEINKAEPLNPIKQDVKNGKLRYVALKYPFNYGALPQTWENPEFVHPDTKAKGDNDPVDAVEISSSVGKIGEVKQV